jgi:hypothetical protein
LIEPSGSLPIDRNLGMPDVIDGYFVSDYRIHHSEKRHQDQVQLRHPESSTHSRLGK